jgi:hypothetical protein
MDPINEAYKEIITEKVNPRDVETVVFDYKDASGAITEFTNAIKKLFKGHVTESGDDSGDSFIFYVSKKKLSDSDVKELDSAMM